MLNPTQRKTLLEIARQTIAAAFEGRKHEPNAGTIDPVLREPAGAFVTLTEHEELRGCIGSIVPTAPLYQAVAASAYNAAFRDPRFLPVTRSELDHLKIEISVMGPIVDVEKVEEIEVGRDGLIISRGPNAGLLLPQVATEYGWDRQTFLSQTCVKAGLPRDAWRSGGCRIQRFSAEVFGESNG